ncbi:autotransporter domain-containing protein [Luteimonas sp. RD2P54]|uniref:Autotransporter domain-containing protein n=1 Tax=Luteimonas endophytica TaxID=3042023 RepID=A0ABT6J6D6_9GAMM|nr:autotransporter domain-containing protein [Luteimonas endophytica]MDH5821743.1 autotransporter domain-containing protein [Luteimonas endophytica]
MARAVGGVPAAPAQGRSRAIGSTIQSNLGDIAMQHCQGASRACRRASKGHRAHPLAQAIALEVRRPAAPRRARPLALAAAALLAAGTAGPLMAQSWTGTISSDWFDPDNWQEGTVPAGGQAVIDTTAPNATEIAAGAATAAEVVVGSTGSGRLAIHSGGTLASGYGVIGNGAGSNGLVSVDGAGAAWLVTGPDSPQIQIGSSGTGRLEVTNGGRVDAQQLLAVGALAAGDGTLVVDGAGSLATSGAVVVGYGGSGTLLLGGGGRIESTLGYLGNAAGSSGTATVTGPGTLWDTSALVVGSGGAGELHIQDGGAVEADVATFGSLAGVQGEASVTTGGSLASAGQLIVGQAGIGSLAVDTGGSASANSIVLGETAGGEGTATVAGNASSLVAANGLTIGLSGTGALGVDTGATVQVGAVLLGANAGALGSLSLDGSGSLLTQAGGVDSFVVGHAGSGTLAIGNGAEVASDEGLVGNGAGGQGEVTVSGAGSAWNMTGNLFVGVGGTGSVDVTDGSVASASGILGRFAGASGTVTVGGAGANWNLGNSLEIGRAGEGTLLVEQGGTVSGIDGILGAEATGSGSALVRGAGSSWSTSVDLVVGSSGNGALTLADGGTVQVGGAMVLADVAGSSGTLVLGAAAGDPAAAAGTLDAATVELGAGSGTIVFNHTGSGYAFDAAIGGNGTLEQLAGTTILTGAGDAGGAANVAGGTLLVEGSLGNMTTTVHGGATLGGSGAIGGGVLVQDGGVLAPGSSAGTLTLGSLTLSSGAILDYELGQAGVVGGGVNDLIAIDGDLVLDGTLDVTDIGGFGAGVYRLMDYGGALTDNGLDLGLLPGGTDPQDLFLQTAIGGQVNLVNSAGMVLSFWDGADASGHNNGAVDGGDGAWNAADGNWTDAGGALNGLWDDGVFAVFGGSAGTVTVEGEQAIGGAQFMADYTLAAGTGGALRVDDAATVIRVDPGVTAAIGTPIAGSGGLVKTDTGTLVLSAANTYAGGTRIDRGTLQVSSDANLGAASGGLRFDGGTLRNTAAFDSARDIALDAEGGVLQTDADLALSGTIGGAGTLTKTGAGTLTLAGANTHAGGTRIEAGALQVSTDASLGHASAALTMDGGVLRTGAAFASDRNVALLAGGGTFDAGPDLALTGNIAGTGALRKTGAGTLTLRGDATHAGGTTVEAGTLRLGDGGSVGSLAGDVHIAGGAGFVFDRGDSFAFDGDLSGNGALAKRGDGTLVLTGDSGAFAGTGSLEAGALRIDGTLGGTLAVASGALLGGTGTLGSVDNAGTVAAGDSIGTLTLAGDYVHRAGAVLAVEIEPGGSADLLDVAGSATLEGGLVEVAKAPGQYAGGTRYTLIDAAGGLSGSFDAFEQDLPFLDLSLAYDANHAYLDVARSDVDFDIVCGDGSLNQCRVAGALDAIGERGDLTPAMEAVLTEVTTLTLERARAGFDRLSGEAHASFAGMMLEGHALYGRTVARRLAERREAVGAERLRGGTWVRAYGSGSELDGDGNAHGAHLELYGVAAGVDAWAGESWLVGASLNTLKVDADFRDGDGGEADAKNIALYTSVQGERAYLDVATSYAWWDSEVSRLIQVGDIGHRASSDYGMHRFATHVEAGLNYPVGGGLLQPLLSAEWSLLSTEGFRESGADALGLVGSAHNVERTVAGLGLRWSGAFGGGAWRLAPTAQARWLHTFGDLHAEFDVALAGAPDAGFRTRGVTVPEDRALLGVGLQASRDTLDLFVDLDYQAGDDFDAASIGAGMRWRW